MHKRPRRFFTRSALIYVYNTCILPYMIYFAAVWGNALSIHINPLIRHQRKNIRIITSLKFVSDKTIYLLYHRHSPIQNLKYRISLLIYNLSTGNASLSRQQLFKNKKDIHTHFTRQSHYFHYMKGKNGFIYKTFVFQSVVIRNKTIEYVNMNAS